ncbi:MAG TPA: hypothetical protein VEH77_14180, partial [Roseiarcus sp.]|nr:hypothetical protein [Roseiarcus sp.]
MSESRPDKMIIQTFGFGPSMTAQQSIRRARKILLDLEEISPWRRPFNVSGCTAATDDMRIAEDLSDFDKVVMHALQSYTEVRYYNEKEPDNLKLTPDSVSPYGFAETFSEECSEKEYMDRVCVSLQSSGVQHQVSLDDSLYNIEIPAFESGQVNTAWSDPGVVFNIFNYFVDNFDPLGSVVFGRNQLNRIDTPESNYNMGWLNYTRDPKVAAVFSGTGKAVPYRNGVLLKFGDDV